ncbi:MAG: hypothetical protein OXD47_04080, partial [Gammaproteobacteria bacterium]|nr:hypothetical protein [Gammaproteobacteria bacterium]MCY4337959.1 hypothetical protein [Gammaproteobacteria bacterium]
MLENEENEKSHFFISVSENATDGIFRGYRKINNIKTGASHPVNRATAHFYTYHTGCPNKIS